MRAFLPLVLLPFPALADSFALSPTVEAALVTGDGGVVTYAAPVALPAGRHTLTVRLPVVDDRINVVDVRLPDGVTLVSTASVVERAAPAPRTLTDRQQAARDARIAAERALEAHRARIADLEAKVAAAETRRTLAEATAKAGLAGGDTLPTAEQITALAAVVAQTVQSAAAEIAALRVEIAALAPVTADLEQAVQEARAAEAAAIPEARQNSGVLSLQVNASAGLTDTVRIDTLENVIWEPLYEFDLRQEGDTGTLVIDRLARLSYFTTDWQDFAEPVYPWTSVDITLSTADLSGQTQTFIPSPILQRLVDKAERKRLSASYGASASREVAQDEAMPEPVVAEVAANTGGVAHFGQTVVFPLGPGQALDLSADRAVFDIDRITVPLDLYGMANAARDRHAFLYADLKNTSAGVWLAGGGLLSRDGTVIGSIRLPTLLPGQEEPLGLGPLYGLRLERDTLSVQEGDSGLLTSRSEEDRRYRTTTTSSLDYGVELRLVDVAPTSESEDLRITVNARPAPDTDTRDGKRGVHEWRLTMAPGAQQVVDFGWRAQWPADKVPVRK